jgi:hypothetical protein
MVYFSPLPRLYLSTLCFSIYFILLISLLLLIKICPFVFCPHFSFFLRLVLVLLLSVRLSYFIIFHSLKLLMPSNCAAIAQ